VRSDSGFLGSVSIDWIYSYPPVLQSKSQQKRAIVVAVDPYDAEISGLLRMDTVLLQFRVTLGLPVLEDRMRMADEDHVQWMWDGIAQ
jgi:hypothetical protein